MNIAVPIQWNDDVLVIDDHLDEYAKWTRKDLPPGTAGWARGQKGEIAVLRFVCPCGCGTVASIPVVQGYGGHWTWNGNETKPTLNPSIFFKSGCGWHGYLRDGIFT